MRYSKEEALKAAYVMLPDYKKYDLDVYVTENLLSENDEERYYYEVSYIKRGKEKHIVTFFNRHIRDALRSLKKVYGYCRISRQQQSIDRQIRNIKAEFPKAIIVQEAYTGTKMDRPEWSKLYKKVEPGDTIVFDSVSRMSRDAEEGFRVYEELFNRGVYLIFLKEPHINTETYRNAMETGVPLTGTNVDYILEGVNKYLMTLAKEQIRLAFIQSEKEVEDLRQRTREGIETARLNGKQIGQPKGAKLTTKKEKALKKLIREYNHDFEGSLSDKETISMINGMEEIKTDKGEIINPHIGTTKSGKSLNRYINRHTFYKYKRELKEEFFDVSNMFMKPNTTYGKMLREAKSGKMLKVTVSTQPPKAKP